MEINRALLNNGDLVLPRKDIPVPELRKLFKNLPENEIPMLTIRALTGRELFLVAEAATQNQLRTKLIEGLREAPNDSKAGEVMAAILSDKERDTDEFRRRLVIFRCGVIDEKGHSLFDEIETATIAEKWGVAFANVSLEIMTLNQEGPRAGE